MSYLFDNNEISVLKTNRNIINNVSLVILGAIIIISCICIIILINKEINNETNECEHKEVKPHVEQQETVKPYKFTKITKQYYITKTPIGNVNITSETNVESNVKNDEFTKLVTDVINNDTHK